MSRYLTVRYKILIPTCLVAAMLVFGLSHVFIGQFEHLLETGAANNTSERARSLARAVEMEMNAAIRTGEILAAMPSAHCGSETRPQFLRHIMLEQIKALPGLLALWAEWRCGDEDDRPAFSGVHRLDGEPVVVDASSAFPFDRPDWVSEQNRPRGSGDSGIRISSPTDLVRGKNRIRVIRASVPVRYQNKSIGLVGMLLSPAGLERILRRISLADGGSLLLADSEGRIIASSGGQRAESASGLPADAGISEETAGDSDADDRYPVSDLSSDGNGLRGLFPHPDTSSLITGFAPIRLSTAAEWTAGAALPRKEVLARTDAVRQWAWMAALTAVATMALVIFIISHFILKPLNRLVHVSLHLANGKFDTRADIRTRDEFGMAARHIDKAFDIVIRKMYWYEAILDAVPFPISVTDMDMRWQFMNQSYAERVGRDRKKLYGMACSIQNTPICQTGQCGAILLRKGITESSYHDEDTGHHYQINTAWLTDSAGRQTGHVEVVQDVTDSNRLRREMEKQNWLRTGEADLNQRMSGDQGIRELSRNILHFLCHYVNAPVGLLYLYDESEKILKLTASRAHRRRKHLADRFALGEGLVGQAALEREPIMIEGVPDDYLRIASGLGEAAPREIIAVPFLFEEELRGVIELCRLHPLTDIQRDFLYKTAEQIGIAVNTTAARSRLQELFHQTRHQAEELKLQKEELHQANAALNDQAAALRQSEAGLQRQQDELRVVNEELEEKTKDLMAQRDAIREKNQDLEEIQIELEKKAKELESANRYKSEFLANMSHELRTPLNSILILSQLLTRNADPPLSEKQMEFATTIHSSGQDLLSLINDILDLSKIEAGKFELNPEQLALSDLIARIRNTYQPVADLKEIAFEITAAENLPPHMHTDGKRLWQILKNLLSNAFKFTESGRIGLDIGAVSLAASFPDRTEDNQSQPEPADVRETRMIYFAVSDTGIGIAKAEQKLVFEAFRQADGTTRRKYEGTGLGLSISREFAEVMGGWIQLESRQGEGAIFTLYIPVALSIPLPSSREPGNGSFSATPAKCRPGFDGIPFSPAEPVQRPSRHPAAIDRTAPDEPGSLRDDRRNIGEDDRTVLLILRESETIPQLYETAHEQDWKCLVAEDGESGLYLADFYQPAAIILDEDLPGINGWDVMTRLKHNLRTRHIPVHFVSDSDPSVKALRMGAVGVAAEPPDGEFLSRLFSRFTRVSEQKIKRVMVVEDDQIQLNCITELIEADDILITALSDAEEAHGQLQKQEYDLLILDLGLANLSGFDLLAEIRKAEHLQRLPVIIYTGRDISKDENAVLEKYADSIIIKGACSPERLLDETTLFLHRVESEMEPAKQRMLHSVYKREALFEGKKALIIDDDMRNVFAVGAALEERGMRLVEAMDGKEGLETLQSHPDTDIILMDIMMPEMDGYETIRRIRELKLFKDLPIIALTAKAMRGDRHKCLEAGANDYMAKPIDTDKLMSLMRVWLYR